MVRTLEINWPTFQVTKLSPRMFNDFAGVNPLGMDIAQISIQASDLSKKTYFMFAIVVIAINSNK